MLAPSLDSIAPCPNNESLTTVIVLLLKRFLDHQEKLCGSNFHFYFSQLMVKSLEPYSPSYFKV